MRDSFLLFTENADLIRDLDDQQAGKLFKAIFDYQSGIEPAFDDLATSIVFKVIRRQMDACAERYEQTLEARREAGKLGGRPKAEKQTKAKKANGFFEKQTKANESKEKQTEANESKEKQTEAKKPDTKTDTETDLKEKTPVGVEKKERFTPPTPTEVREYAAEKGYHVDAEKFCDFYASKGWMVGRNPMRDWKAAVRNWDRSQRQEEATKGTKTVTTNRFNNFPQRQYDYDELEKQLLMGGG